MENYLKPLIQNKGFSLKSFSDQIGLPYSTLLSMLSRKFDGASIGNIEKVCKGLSITIDEFVAGYRGEECNLPFITSEEERLIISKYRENPDMQPAVEILLGLRDNRYRVD